MNYSTKSMTRAAMVAAIYCVLTLMFQPISYGPVQFRISEALCILPLLFPEAIPALYVGCLLFNLTSPYLLYDVLIGSAVTLLAALATYLVGVFLKNEPTKLLLGGLFPILFNAVFIPMIIVFLCGGDSGYASVSIAYWTNFGLLFLTQAIWVYGLGIPLYFLIKRLREKNLAFFN